ncbi:serine hydrolase [Billgrantia sulfidoxydans]|uniref:Serine hydrolase n=1 Tax=Billgrantia sulfidoxydans TaxID=2733484 RepID=A0ABX7W3H2_9GAMM|nr:serine hydrolase [Halomonas sulfidoxydans]QTP54715.1 serine hydrolase [Halomonas sulfidoxydans]
MRALLLLAMTIPSLAVAQPGWAEQVEAWVEPPWAERLDARLALLDAGFHGELGVHVRNLETGARHGWRDAESWYLASLVKVPVAIELMARVEAGEMALRDRLMLARSDYVDGAGSTNWASPGSALPLRRLLESMLVASDNTASDMLMRHLGVERVNERVRRLTPAGGLGPITTLVDVRRRAYANLHPDASGLSGMDFIELRKRDGEEARLAWFLRRLGLSPPQLLAPSIDEAFQRYYATDLNSGRLDAYGDLLEALALGRALGPDATAELLAVMSRTRSGDRRLKAGLGHDIRLAHKTGTQHRLACDAGIATQGQGEEARRVVIVACVRGELDLARNEQMLAAVGRAVREAGAFEG